MLQVYQVCHQPSPWYIICMTQGLPNHAPSVTGLSSTITLVHYMYDPGPSKSCSKWTRSVINYHPGTYMFDPGPLVTCSKCTRSVINYHPGTLRALVCCAC